MKLTSKVRLNNGIEMPYLGLGVYQIRPGEAERVFRWAIDIGYRLFDTASLYGNEKEVGAAVSLSTINRNEFFITSKLWNSDHGYQKAISAFDKSMDKFNLDYIDLYLIHWPVTTLRLESWAALESLLETGRVKSIGVSNFMVNHLEELLDNCSVIPSVNQIEFHPWLYNETLLEYCKQKKIQLQAYSPLTKGRYLGEETLNWIGEKYKKSPAQILIRWCLEHQISTIPKSANKQHLHENADVFNFSLAEEDMEKLNLLNIDSPVTWDPRQIP
ncbi:MAG: aldo/keto reductase [Candidatus Hodarchaeales archaeon]|jgi:diketogulonate reductase-like aldo/keto reductase